jgi:hypothetical protein
MESPRARKVRPQHIVEHTHTHTTGANLHPRWLACYAYTDIQVIIEEYGYNERFRSSIKQIGKQEKQIGMLNIDFHKPLRVVRDVHVVANSGKVHNSLLSIAHTTRAPSHTAHTAHVYGYGEHC